MMSDADGKRSEQHLRELLGKINHPLLEVRSRCLRGVSFKLKNGIVAASELVHERAFLTGLLEWFNFEEWALESHVLGLIAQLAEHEAAAQILVEVGGVEFLSQLRLHCDPSLHPLLDEILEQLLKLPGSVVSGDNATPTSANGVSPLNEPWGTSAVQQYSDVPVLSQSSQYTFTTESTSDFGSYPQVSARSFQLTDEYTGLPQQYLQKALSVGSCTTNSQSDGAYSSPSLEKPIKDAYPAPQGAQVERRVDSGRQTSHPHFLYGSTPAAVTTDTTESFSEERAQPHVTADMKNGGTFPWLKLSVNDRHILATTESRLQSSTPEALQRSCEFIHDVLLQDFPAELFLQRPALVKCLLKLLDERETGSNHYCILQCLLELTGHLKSRMALYQHTAMGSTDKLTLSYESEPVCVTSATALERAVPTPSETSHQPDKDLHSSDLKQLTPEMLFQLQSESISVQRYCNAVFTCVAPLLLSYINRDFAWMREKKQGATSAAKPVAAHISLWLRLLFIVSGLSEQLNADGPLIRETTTLECLSSCLSQCLSKWRRLGAQASPPAPQLQTVCTVTVCLARCLGKMLSTGLPSSNPLSAPVVSVLRDLVMNGVISVTHPDVQDTLLPFLERADPSSCKLFRNVRAFSRTFKQKTAFHTSCKQKESCSRLVSLATDALPGLLFVCDEEFVAEAMKLCTQLMTQESAGSGWDSAKLLLLRLLGHESERVQELAYSQFKSYVISSVAEPEHQASESPAQEGEPRSFVFPALLDCDVMKEVCCRGALSSIQGICSAAHEILATLLNLKEELYWPELRDALLQWLPFIEVSTANHGHLCKQFQELLDAGEASGVPRITQLHSYLRLLFSENIELRVWSFTSLCKLLISDDSGKLSPFSSEASLPLHDVLLLGKPSHTEWDVRRQSSFQRDDVVKLLHILRSPVMDTALKKSALEQLAMLLQDCSLQELALEEGILADILTAFEAALHGRTTSQEEGDFTDDPLKLLNPCIRCLQLLTHPSATLRGQLSANDTFLLDIFRASLLCHKDPELLYSTSKLLASLLFAPVARFSQPGNETSGIQLPESISNRLRFPFPMGLYTLDPCHSTPSPLELKLLSSEPPLSMLRLHYHIAVVGSVEKLATASKEDLHTPEEKLVIPESDFVALKGLHMSTALSDSFKRLQASASHNEVIDRLHHLGVVLQCFRKRDVLRKENKTEELDWKLVLERYLTAHPATPEDSALLTSILQFIHSLLCTDSTSVDLLGPLQLTWLADITSGPNAICLLLLQSFVQSADEHKHNSGDPQRALQKTLLQFYASLMGRVARTADVGGYSPLRLVQTLCQCLDVAGSPNYYDLPLLESSLECLKHLTASHLMQKACGAEWLALCMKLMTSLRQVLWSFLSGRGSLLASFMGKGVTSRAALSLSHLLPTIAALGPPEGWWLQWLQSSPDSGLLWLHLLVEDREPQVQYAGLSLLASLCSQSCVVEFILASWTTAHPLGLWGVCLGVALDPGGCGLIKQQALLVLVSLSTVCIRLRKWNQYLHYSTDEFTLQGQQALEVLLDHFNLIPALLARMQAQPFGSLKQSTATLLQELPPAMTEKFSQPSTLATKLTEALSNSRQPTKEEQECHTLCKDSDFRKVTSRVQQVLKSCNPQLMSGACRLLSNLLLAFPVVVGAQLHNHGFIKGLIRILDPDVLKLFLLTGSFNATSRFSCSAWVRLATDAISLLRGAVLLNPNSTLPHLLKEAVVMSLCKMFACVATFQESRQNPEYLTLCYTIMALLQSVIEKVNCAAKAEVVFSSLQLHWESFVYLLYHCLHHPGPAPPALRGMGLKLLCSVLAHRFHEKAARTRPDPASQALRDTLRFLLDGTGVTDCGDSLGAGSMDDGLLHRNGLIPEREQIESSDSSQPTGSIPNGSHNTSGSVLCEALLKAYDGTAGREHRRGGMVAKDEQLISATLGILLACSTSAKQFALKSGLMESALEQMKTLHAKLCMESLDQASQSNRKKKDSPLMTELIAAVNLLRNFMYESLDVKCAALESHLPAVIHKLWSWCTVERKLLLPVLRLLTVITAQHAQGRVSLASSGKGSNSLLHSVLKLASHSVTSHDSCSSAGVASPHLDTIRAVFTLLANCALSTECRAVMKKVNFLSSFLTLTPKSEKAPASGGVRLSTVWCHFLGNLTLSAEGQQMIAKIPGFLDVLLDIYQCTSDDTQTQCLQVLRNLCFYGPNKTILSSNENFLMALSSSLGSEERKQTALAASAVWALLHNCSKIKNSLKKAGLSKKLESIDSTLKVATSDNSRDSNNELCRNTVSQALSLIQ